MTHKKNAETQVNLTPEVTNELITNEIPDITTLQELLKDCTAAVVTYGIQQPHGTDELKPVKTIMFYNSRQNFNGSDDLEVGIRQIMMKYGDISLCKSYVYSLRKEGFLKKISSFATVLYRNVAGFIPNSKVSDRRNEYNKYHNKKSY